MKNNTTIAFSCIICSLMIIISCTDNKRNELISNLQMDNYNIDMPKSTELSVVDSVKYIMLDEKCLFSSISKIVKVNDKIVIFDKYGSEKILVFDVNGNYINSIGRKGRAENEYVKPWDIAIKGNHVLIYDWGTQRMITYDMDGNYVKSQKSAHIIEGFAPLKNGNFLAAMAKEDNSIEICILSKTLDLVKELKMFDKACFDDKITDNLFQITDSTILYNRPIDYTVYEFNNFGEPIKKYNFDFWKNNASKEITYSYEKFVDGNGKKKYTYMYDCPLKIGNSFVCSLISKGIKCGLFYNPQKRNSIINEWKPQFTHTELFLPIYAEKNLVYGWMDDSMIELISDKEEMPIEVINHLQKHGKVISIYHLNRNSI